MRARSAWYGALSPSVPKPGTVDRDVVGGVEVAGRNRDRAVAVERGGVVDVELGRDRLPVTGSMPSSMVSMASWAARGVLEPAFLVVGELAALLEQAPVGEVAVEGDGVGGVAGLGRDAVEVADRAGRRGDDRLLLLVTEPVPPGVDLLRRRTRPGLRARAASAGSATPPYRRSTWSSDSTRSNASTHRLLLGSDIGHPGVEVGLQATYIPGAVVALGLEGRPVRLDGGPGPGHEAIDGSDQVAPVGRHRGASFFNRVHRVGVVVGPLGDTAQRQ